MRKRIKLWSILIDCYSAQVCYHNNLYLEKADVMRDKMRTRGLRLHLFTEGSSVTRVLLEPKKRCLTKEVAHHNFVSNRIHLLSLTYINFKAMYSSFGYNADNCRCYLATLARTFWALWGHHRECFSKPRTRCVYTVPTRTNAQK